jgi:FtsH-binding integral membrane protein
MKKIKEIFKLSDPYPNIQYEILCYIKAILGLGFFVLGVFLLFLPFIRTEPVFLGFAPVLGPLGLIIFDATVNWFGQNFVLFCLVFGTVLIIFGLWIFWQIKLVKKLFKLL